MARDPRRPAHALLIALALTAAGCGAGAERGGRSAISLVTFNWLHGLTNEDRAAEPFDRFPERFPLIVEALAERQPAIVLLQEVRPSGPTGYPDVIGTLLSGMNGRAPGGYVTVFGDILGSATVVDGGELLGQAIVSRFRVVESHNHPVTRVDPFDLRSVVHARVAAPSVAIDVYDAHLEGPPVAAPAAAELEDVVAFVDATVGPEGVALLGGDLNSPFDAPVYDVLRDAGFVSLDALAGLRCAPPDDRSGCTNETFPLGEPGNRTTVKLDSLWVRAPRAFRSSAEPIFDQPALLHDGTTLWLSDHIGVAATVRFDP